MPSKDVRLGRFRAGDRRTTEVLYRPAEDLLLLSVSPERTSRALRSGDGVVLSAKRTELDPPSALLFALLKEEAGDKELRKPAVAEALARALAACLERAAEDRARRHSFRRGVGDTRILKAMTLLHADPARRWTVEKLARAVGLSRPVFARRFLESTRLSPVRYLTQRRMELAAGLLRETDAGLSEVAVKVGYDSEFAFSRAFKRHHGLPPGLFRRQGPGLDRPVMRAA